MRPLNCNYNAGNGLDINGSVSRYGKLSFSDVELENVRIDKIIPYF
jgi:hypothetical protein